VGVGCNAFAIESFLDEIAKAQRRDPLELRLALTEGAPRAQTLLRTVAEMSDWTQPRDGTALGLAMMEKDETVAAGVAEVSLDRASGRIKVHNIWAAIDAGLAVQPRNLACQTEGSIVFGLGHLLREKITIRNGRVQETNFTWWPSFAHFIATPAPRYSASSGCAPKIIMFNLPSLAGFRPRSELRIAFSMAPICEVSQGCSVIKLGSGTCKFAS